jgi:hypothetical protein
LIVLYHMGFVLICEITTASQEDQERMALNAYGGRGFYKEDSLHSDEGGKEVSFNNESKGIGSLCHRAE